MHSPISPSSPAPTIKTKLNHLLHKQVKNIKIIKALGTGANATVYLGEIVTEKSHFFHPCHSNQYVAVKQLHTEDKKHVQHLTEEYCIASQLQHMNIVKVLDLFYDHYWCYVSEYCGVELYKWIEEGMTTTECNSVLVQLLSAVVYIHEMGICHRDIKPENILYQEKANGIIKLCDFGLAVRYKTVFEDEEESFIDGIEGSDPYMAPEIWNDHYKGPPIDVWATAIVYADTILKKRLWCKATDDDKFYMQYKAKTKTWKDFAPFTDAALLLVLKMLDIDPQQRISAKDALNYANFHL